MPWIIAVEMGGAVDDGGVDDLAGAAVGAGVLQGGEDADDEVEGAARVVAEEVGGDGGRAVGRADHAEGAGDGDVGDVVAGARGRAGPPGPSRSSGRRPAAGCARGSPRGRRPSRSATPGR